MRPFLLALAVLLSVSVPACVRSTHTQHPTSGSITFGNERPGPGTVLHRHEASYFEGRARVRARRIKVAIRNERTRRERLLAVEHDEPTYLVVTYERARSTTTTPIDGSNVESDPVENRTYRVWRGASSRLRRQDGSSPSLEESLTLVGDYTLSSHPIAKLDTLRGQTVRFGEEIRSGSVAVLDFANPKVTARLIEQTTHDGRPVAVFEVHMQGDESGATYELEGVAVFDIRTAALVKLTAKGPMTYKEPGAKVRGTVSLHLTHDYD